MSRPTRARGLKYANIFGVSKYYASRPTRARGLKYYACLCIKSYSGRAPRGRVG